MKQLWETALLTLDDRLFFDLVRNYLGNIQSPYNKQRLVAELGAWISKEENKKTLIALLDDSDKKILAAVQELRSPSISGLSIYLSLDIPYSDLHDAVVSLEERLVLFRFREDLKSHLAINPLLLPDIMENIDSHDLLFHSKPRPEKTDTGQGLPPFGLNKLAALAAWLNGRSDIFKVDGGLKKKFLNELTQLLSTPDPVELMGLLSNLRIIKIKHDTFSLNSPIIASMANINAPDFQLYAVASLLIVRTIQDGGFLSASRLSELLFSIASLVHRLLKLMDFRRVYPAQTIRRMLMAANRPHVSYWKRLDELFDRQTNPFIDALLSFGLLYDGGDGFYGPSEDTLCPAEPALESALSSAEISIDATFSVTAGKALTVEHAFLLAGFLDVCDADTVLRWELTRDSAIRAFNAGIDSQKILDILNQLSLNRVPQNIQWSLDDWQARYKSLGIYQGTFLTVSEERRVLLQSPEIKPFIYAEISPGVYLIDDRDIQFLEQALAKAGADIIARPTIKPQKRRAGQLAFFRSFGPSPTELAAPTKLPASTELAAPIWDAASCPDPDQPSSIPASARIEQHNKKLFEKLEKLALPADQEAELFARIERRLILDPSQLIPQALRWEKLEARGLDYVGKLRVAEQSMAQGALLEINWRSPGAETKSTLASLRSIQKSGNEVNLLLDPIPFGSQLIIPLSKISLIRRVKRSIFGE